MTATEPSSVRTEARPDETVARERSAAGVRVQIPGQTVDRDAAIFRGERQRAVHPADLDGAAAGVEVRPAGAVTSETVIPPSSEETVSGPSMWLACTGPPPESRFVPLGAVTSVTVIPPSSEETLSGPSMSLACTGPPPESRFAPATPATAMPPSSLSARDGHPRRHGHA